MKIKLTEEFAKQHQEILMRKMNKANALVEESRIWLRKFSETENLEDFRHYEELYQRARKIYLDIADNIVNAMEIWSAAFLEES